MLLVNDNEEKDSAHNSARHHPPLRRQFALERKGYEELKAVDTQKDTSLDTQVGQFIAEKWVDLKTAYWMYHSWIWGALLMYAGELWIEYAPSRQMYQRQVPKDDFVPQPRINKFAPAIDAIASNFQQVPEVEAVATPMDDLTNVGIAEIANLLAQHYVKESGLRSDYQGKDDKVGMAGQLFVLTGCLLTNNWMEDKEVARRPRMDEKQGFGVQCMSCDKYAEVPEEPEACPTCGNPDINLQPVTMMAPAEDEEGNPQTEPITERHVRCDIENPLYFYPRSGSRSMEDRGWMMVAERMSLDQIYSRFGVEAQADSEYPDGWNTTNENALNFFYMGYSNVNLSGKDAAMVIRCWCEPGKVRDFPEGFYAVYVNGECKKATKWNFLDDPFSKAAYKGIPTLIMPRSVAFDLVQVQKELGDLWSIFKLHSLTNAVDPWIVDKDAQVSEITGRGDKIIYYRKLAPDTEAPHHAQHGALDPALYTLLAKLEAYFDQIGQTVSVFKGEQPGDVTAGNALATLRSQAEFMFAGPVGAWNNCWKETVRKGVKNMQKFYSVAQLAEIIGPDKEIETQAFIHCDLDACVEWIASRAGLPRTRDERRQEMMTLYDKGALDINDPQVKQKLFELFGDTGMMSTFSKDATRARMENVTIKSGGNAVFMPEIEDMATHYGIHTDMIKSQDFLKWPALAQQKLIAHAIQTKDAMGAQQPQPVDLQKQAMKGQQDAQRTTIEAQKDLTKARIEQDTRMAVAEIGAKAPKDANDIAAFMGILDRTLKLLEGGAEPQSPQPAALPPTGGPQQ